MDMKNMAMVTVAAVTVIRYISIYVYVKVIFVFALLNFIIKSSIYVLQNL